MTINPSTDSYAGPLEEKKTRRGLLALIGAGGVAAVAAALGRDTPAQAAHDGTNVFHVGEDNIAPSGSLTILAADVADAALGAINTSSGEVAAGVAGIASTLLLGTSIQGAGVTQSLRDRLRDLRFFIRTAAVAAGADDGVIAQGVPGNGFGVVGLGDLAGVLGSGAVGVFGASDDGGAGVSGVGSTGPGVLGNSESGPGVSGASNIGPGVRGEGKIGVRGYANGPGKVGVHAWAVNGASLALKVEGGALLLPRLTSAKRNALSAVNGMLIYNTSVNRVQARVGGSWVNL